MTQCPNHCLLRSNRVYHHSGGEFLYSSVILDLWIITYKLKIIMIVIR